MEYGQLKYMLSGTQKEDKLREGMQLPFGTLSATIYNSNPILNSNLTNAFMILGEAEIITSTPSLTIALSTRGEAARTVLNLTSIIISVHTRAALERVGTSVFQEFYRTSSFSIPTVLLLLLVWLFLSGQNPLQTHCPIFPVLIS